MVTGFTIIRNMKLRGCFRLIFKEALKLFFCVAVVMLVSSCESVGKYDNLGTDAKGRQYDSDALAKDWRSQFKKAPKRLYPMDNDSDYYYPKYGYPQAGIYRPIPVKPVIIPPAHYRNYPRDNDSEYINPYPRYDPDADNPPFSRTHPSKASDPEQYDYPLYFDD